MKPCQDCGERAATVYTLCRACRHKQLRAQVTATLSRVGGGGAARPLPRAHEEERERDRQDGADDASEAP